MVAVPFDLLTRMVDELGRNADAAAAYHRDALPHLIRLREIEEARDRARAAADAERLESRGALARIFTSTPAVVVYTAVVVLLANYLAGIAGIAPQAVKDGLAAGAEHAEP
jgi:hypothetical protein